MHELVVVGRFGDWWVARAPWTALTTQGRTQGLAVDALRDAFAAMPAMPAVPDEQAAVAVSVPPGRLLPTAEALEASGLEVQRVLERHGFRVTGRSRHHVVLHDPEAGNTVVVPLEVELAGATITDLLRQAALRADEVRALL